MQDRAASVQGAVIRVSALNSDGTIASGASSCYVTDAFMHVTFTPNYDSGNEVLERNASGGICVAYKSPDTLKDITVEVELCEPDPELTQLLCGGTILSSGGQSVGWAGPSQGVDATPNGCAIEVWSYAVANGTRRGTNPFYHWVFPAVKLTPNGSRVVEDGALANVFSGTGTGNSGFGDGPANDWPFISDRPYQYARTSTAPLGQKGYVTVS